MSREVLVVDLDGSLVRSDLLHEAVTEFAATSPRNVMQMAGWLRRGKAPFKDRLAQVVHPDPETLPYHPELLEWLIAERQAGRTLVLASASPRAWADAVASHLGIFDLVVASDSGTNLNAVEKRDRLVTLYSERGYDYVGNHAHDLPVWASARTAHLVGGSSALRRRADSVSTLGRTFSNPSISLPALIGAMRLHQWAKNLLIFVPIVSAQLLGDWSAIGHSVGAFAAFCLASSGVYVLNDLTDIRSDRGHPTKSLRPFARGLIAVKWGWLLAPALVAIALTLAMASVSWSLAAVLLAYLALTSAYSFGLKRRAVYDVITLATLYTIRIVAGAVAVAAPLSMWLLTFAIFVFLSLALVKRVSEVARMHRAGIGESELVSGRGYQVGDLEMLSSLGVGSGLASAVVISLYVSDPTTTELYQTPEFLWGTVPVLLFWMMRVWLLAHRGQMNEDPVVFAISDRTSIAAGAVVMVMFVLAKLIP